MTFRSWRLCLLLAAGPLAGTIASAQMDADVGERLLRDAAVRKALSTVRPEEPRTIADQIRLCEIPAPPFKEEARARAYADAFRAVGLENVRIDAEGNVLGERRGRSARPHLVFSAHLDTVFPEGTDVTVTREGSMLRGPGIGDDCRGLAVILAVARAMNHAAIQTPGTITFVGTVGEEGLGDLRGVTALFRDTLKGEVDRFVSVDGTGLGITHISVGSLRYRVTFTGPGGHSYGAFGIANPMHALGRAIAALSDLRPPVDPRTTFNVGRVGGGTSVNAIAADAWMEVDMRSADRDALRALDARFHEAVEAALAAENARWGNRGRLSVITTLVSDRPAGRLVSDAPIVAAAVSVTRALGLPVELTEGSTDANLPMSLDIPAITIDAGGDGTGAHSLAETFDTTDSWQGTERALLAAIALAQ
jgi:acetylornithine deacetylase/succinyl-diaminopimelate desuccinylase-like protein